MAVGLWQGWGHLLACYAPLRLAWCPPQRQSVCGTSWIGSWSASARWCWWAMLAQGSLYWWGTSSPHWTRMHMWWRRSRLTTTPPLPCCKVRHRLSHRTSAWQVTKFLGCSVGFGAGCAPWCSEEGLWASCPCHLWALHWHPQTFKSPCETLRSADPWFCGRWKFPTWGFEFWTLQLWFRAVPKHMLKSAAVLYSKQLVLYLRCVFNMPEFKPMLNRMGFLVRIQTVLRVQWWELHPN